MSRRRAVRVCYRRPVLSQSLLVFICVVVGAAVPVGCAESLPTHALVRRVVDGDTIELHDGRLVRYIGIDTPEVRRRSGETWIEDPQPFSKEASAANRALVEGKPVRLEYDVQTHDRYGRLLAYVYVANQNGTERMVNARLLQEGFAQLLTIPPDVKYAQRFRALAEEARRAGRGLWRNR